MIFSPDNFKDNIYGWMTNQISHVAVSLFATWLLGMPLFVFSFWIAWESYQYAVSKDIRDAFEDLFFEISGVVIFFNTWFCLITATVFLILLYRRTRKCQ